MIHTEENYAYGIKQQNKAVFTHVRKAYHQAIYNAVFKVVKQHQITEEVVQDTFMKVWLYGPRFDTNKGRLYAWICNIARNSAIDAIRSSSYKRAKRVTHAEDALTRQAAHTPDVHLFDLEAHVRSLPQKYADVLTRYYFKGYSYDEISAELEIPLGTVKTRMREAIKRLRPHYLTA
jgi:RNA polymerase sigma factor (sigma-70 family)